MRDRVQHVALELGVVAVPLGVAQHQRELRDQVLQIVHDEGGHAVEGVELAGLEQRLGRAELLQISGCRARGGLQQVAHFPVDLHRRARIEQHDEADELRAGR